jgi:squalene cyclase
MAEVNRVLKRGDWNEYEIRCDGRRVVVKLNGLQTVDYTEPDESLAQHGLVGLQIHGGGQGEAWFKDLTVEELP